MNQQAQSNPSFISLPYEHGLLFDYKGIHLYGMTQGLGLLKLKDYGTFGFVISGTATLIYNNGQKYVLTPGQYFSAPSRDVALWEITGFSFLVAVPGYRPMFTMGGPIERVGRLKYIDGCTDSLLVPPVKKGDPCFNHLHFPPGINQTMHTHPSVRIGAVVKGKGECVTPFGNEPLITGNLFVITPETSLKSLGTDNQYHLDGSHCFRTFEETMDVIAFHPDSDFGPEDENHPMINRTIVDGVSASQIKEIQTGYVAED